MPQVERAPLLRLSPVELPPAPTDERSKGGGSLAGRALLSIALLAGVLVVAVGVVLALVAANIAIWRLGRVQFGLVILTFAVLAALGRAVIAMVRRPPEPDDEVEVPADAEPELHAMVRELAGVAGTTPPDRIVLIAAVNAYVREVGPLLGLVPGRRTLAIGTPLLDVLTVSQLRAVLAHELGHFAGGDTRLGPVTYRTEIALHRMIESLGGHLIARLFVGYWKLQHRITAAVRRGQELVADRAAVRVAGRQAAADALRTVEVAGRAEALLHQAYLVPLLQAGRRPTDLASGMEALLTDERSLEQLQSHGGDDQSDPWASHPPTPVRIARVAALPETGDAPSDGRAARCLLRDPHDWIRSANDRWLASMVDVDRLAPATWDEWGEVVVAPEQEARASSVEAALAGLGLPGGLDGLEAALRGGRDRELAAALIASGWRAGGPGERDAVLRAAVTGVAAREAVAAHGFRWRVSWSGPVELARPTGEPVALGDLVEAALQGEWAALREVLRGTVSAGEAHAPVGPPPMTSTPGAAAELPPAPVPPFVPGEDPCRWKVELPGRIRGTKVRFALSDEAISFKDATVRWDDVESVRFPIKSTDSGFSVTVTYTTIDGREHKATCTGLTRKTSDVIARAAGYLWEATRAMAGPRLVRDVVEAVRAGGTVEVADLMLSPAGVAHRRNPQHVIPWRDLRDPQAAGQEIQLAGLAGTKAVTTSLGAPNAFLLDEVLPALRALLG
ncbi:MAG: M48 family metallopeptidase [Actinobacteria bacterium]|nr:M48 family metallopeptidase [Actinomycetota bacterium]